MIIVSLTSPTKNMLVGGGGDGCDEVGDWDRHEEACPPRYCPLPVLFHAPLPFAVRPAHAASSHDELPAHTHSCLFPFCSCNRLWRWALTWEFSFDFFFFLTTTTVQYPPSLTLN